MKNVIIYSRSCISKPLWFGFFVGEVLKNVLLSLFTILSLNHEHYESYFTSFVKVINLKLMEMSANLQV